MAADTEGKPTGPLQRGRGVQGQYVYWITQAHPKPETVQRLGLKTPGDFTREEFGKLMVKAHKEMGVDLVETACFLEPHSNGLKHHNCLARAADQFRWLKAAEHLRRKYKVCVDYGSNVKTWAEGVVYGRVASEHKGPEMLDHHYTQWAQDGNPAKLEEFIPRPWKKEGFVRKTKMTHIAFLDLCRNNEVTTEEGAWALAVDLESKGDKGMMAYLLEADVPAIMAKVRQAAGAKEGARRAKLSRMEILQEVLEHGHCTCESPGACYKLIKEILDKNKIDGPFQEAVVGTLKAGRKKMRNLCLVAGTNSAKSYLFKPLTLIFRTYTRPDGGSYQLEDILGKELVFLNDFEYDEDAKKWCPWAYFKRFLEGEPLTVGRPKNRGGNAPFESDAPVFFTAPQEIALYRGKRRDEYETSQMNARVSYCHLQHSILEQDRKETNPCAHCGARVYMEGVTGRAQMQEPSSASSSSGAKRNLDQMVEAPQAAPGPTTRQKTGVDMVSALKELRALKEGGLLDSPEAKKLKDQILSGQ